MNDPAIVDLDLSMRPSPDKDGILNITGNIVDKLITRDHTSADLSDRLNVLKHISQSMSGLDTDSYPSVNVNLTELGSVSHQPIPQPYLAEMNKVQCNCSIGLFTEIGRAWLAVDKDLFLWKYEDGRDLVQFDSMRESILSVALVKPRPNVFRPHINYLLCVATAVEIAILGITFINPVTNQFSLAMMQLLPEAIFSIPTDGVAVLNITATEESGRIFLACSDNSLQEITYQAHEGWFSSRFRRVNHSKGLMSSIGKLLKPSWLFSNDDELLQICEDSSRNLLYTRSKQATISVYYMGAGGYELILIDSMSSKQIQDTCAKVARQTDRSHYSHLIHLSPLFLSDSVNIGLIAITSTGARLYFTTKPFGKAKQTEHDGLHLVHVRLPPTNLDSRYVRSPHYNVALSSKDTYVCIGGEDSLSDGSLLSFYSSDMFPFASTSAPSTATQQQQHPVFSPGRSLHLLQEHESSRLLPAKIKCLQELSPNRSPGRGDGSSLFRNRVAPFDYLPDPPAVVTQHMKSPKKFVLLSFQGSFIVTKNRPVDMMKSIIIQYGVDSSELREFFHHLGSTEACVICLLILSSPTPSDEKTRSLVREAFYLYGGTAQLRGAGATGAVDSSGLASVRGVGGEIMSHSMSAATNRGLSPSAMSSQQQQQHQPRHFQQQQFSSSLQPQPQSPLLSSTNVSPNSPTFPPAGAGGSSSPRSFDSTSVMAGGGAAGGGASSLLDPSPISRPIGLSQQYQRHLSAAGGPTSGMSASFAAAPSSMSTAAATGRGASNPLSTSMSSWTVAGQAGGVPFSSSSAVPTINGGGRRGVLSSSAAPAAPLTTSDWVPSYRHDAILLYLARLLGPLWNSCILMKVGVKKGGGGGQSASGQSIISRLSGYSQQQQQESLLNSTASSIEHYKYTFNNDELSYFMIHLQFLQDFIKEYLLSQTSAASVFSTHDSYRGDQRRKNVNAEAAKLERESIRNANHLIGRCMELIGLIKLAAMPTSTATTSSVNVGTHSVLQEEEEENRFASRIFPQLPVDVQNIMKSLTFRAWLFTDISINQALIKAVIYSHVQQHSSTGGNRSGSAANIIINRLRETCPSLYSDDDAVHSRACELLEKAMFVKNEEDRKGLLDEALALFVRVSHVIDLSAVCQNLLTIKHYQGIIDLCLASADRIDPENKALHFYHSGQLLEDIEGQHTYRQRMRCYGCVNEVLARILHVSRGSTTGGGDPSRWLSSAGPAGALAERAGTAGGQALWSSPDERSQQASSPSSSSHLGAAAALPTDSITDIGITVHEANILVERFLAACLKSSDELFHVSLYDWLLLNDFPSRLVKVKSPYLEKFLAIKLEAEPNNMDLLNIHWQYLENCKEYYLAARILHHLAQTSGDMSIESRVAKYSRAALCLKSGKADSKAVELNFDVHDKLRLARLQMMVLDELRRSEGLILESAAGDPAALQTYQFHSHKLHYDLFDLQQLYDEYMVRYNLSECKLAALSLAESVRPEFIENVWIEIIEKAIERSQAALTVAARASAAARSIDGMNSLGTTESQVNTAPAPAPVKEYVSSKVKELANLYFHSPSMPLKFLVVLLEKKSLEHGFGNSWAYQTFLSAKYQFQELIATYHDLFKFKEFEDQTHLLEVVYDMLVRFIQEQGLVPQFERRRVVIEIMDCVSAYLLELQSITQPNQQIKQLISNFKYLQLQLERLPLPG